MTSAPIPILMALVLACSAAIATIALLRPLLRRCCGAAAALRLWWILPLALVATFLPKSPAPVRIDFVPQVQRAAVALPSVQEAASAPLSSPGIPWERVALAVWLIGALASAARMMSAQWRFSRKVAWGPRRGVLPAKTGPAVLGAIRPRLALPEDFRSRYSAQERRLILLHEKIHLKRRDGLANLGMSVLLILQWFNPLLHWASRAMCRDQESACDAGVVRRHPEALRAYADALLKTHFEAQHLPLVCRWQAYHPTVERIAMLKFHRDIRANGPLAALLLVGGGLLASALAYAAQPAASAAPAAWETQGATTMRLREADLKDFFNMVLAAKKIDIKVAGLDRLAGKKVSVATWRVAPGKLLRTVLFCHGFALVTIADGYAIEESRTKPAQADPAECIKEADLPPFPKDGAGTPQQVKWQDVELNTWVNMMSDSSKLPIMGKEQLPTTKISFPNRNFLVEKATETLLRTALNCNGFTLVPAASGYAIEKSGTPATDVNACIDAALTAKSVYIGAAR